VEVSPGQETLVQKINHDVHERLNVISPALVITSAAVETCKEEIATKLLSINFLNMTTIFIEVSTGQTKVDEINQRGVFVPDQNVIQLQIIVNITHFMQNANSFYLNYKKW
jgi:hypothetical protein